MIQQSHLRVAVLAAASTLACGSSHEGMDARPAFVHVEGEQLLDPSGAPLMLEGVTFGELYPTRQSSFESESRSDYVGVAAMGMNHVRLYINADALEDESAPGTYRPEALAWLDENVTWAGENGLYLVLAVSVPPGGSMLDCNNDAFWDSPEYQDRLIALWRVLAARYADEPIIAGYSPLDTVNPNRSLDQWQDLADHAVLAIRKVDRHHTVFLSRAISIGPHHGCKFGLPAADTFARVNEPNLAYEFDRVQPWDYVAQLLQSQGDPETPPLPEYGSYPDPNHLTIVDSKRTWQYSSEDSRPSARALKLQPGETEWTKKVFYYTVTEPRFAYALPVLQADDTSGKAYFDDILIEEVSEAGAHVIRDIDIESKSGWYFWEGNGEGVEIRGTGVPTLEASAHRGKASLAIEGTTGYANLTALAWAAFPVAVGSSYRVTSWVKGEQIKPAGMARVRLDFWAYSEPLRGLERRALEELFTDLRGWGHAQGVPMVVNSFSTGRPTFENGRGGLAWVSDMIDIMREQQLGFVYWGYRDRDFGIYTNDNGALDPESVNQPLVELLTEKLR